MHADRPRPPLPECSPSQVGPCAGCGHPTCRYGSEANPLCALCRAEVEAGRNAQGKALPALR